MNQLNTETPDLNLDSGLKKEEIIDNLLEKGLWDLSKFRAIVKNNPRVRSVDPGFATVATPINIPSGNPGSSLAAFDTEGLTPDEIEARKAHLAAVEINRQRPKIDPFAATLKKAKPKAVAEAKPETNLNPVQESMLKRRNQLEPEGNQDDEAIFVGDGIKNHILPSTVPFGKIALDLNKLFYQNILSIKRHNGNKIIGHKNKRVSDNFVDIIMKMFDDKPITQSDLKNIKDEQMLYDNLIVQSGLHKLKKIPTNIEQTSEQMKNRLGLITGEIEAGNSNKSLLTELHELLFKMVRVHLISKNAAATYYKNIKDQFYTL